MRKVLLRTTMLMGIVGATYLSVRDAKAGEPMFAPNYAAVDGINGKVEVFGGSYAHSGLYGVRGALAVPLSGPFGLEVFGKLGGFDGRSLGKVGAHWFWRDPSVALLGLYASYLHWNQYGGVNAGQVGVEGEYYWQRFTLSGIVGVEFGNTATGPSTTVTVVPPTFFVNGLAATYAPFYDIKTRFFDEINLKYYWTDNWDGYVGHRYIGGRHALALGSEAALPVSIGSGRLMSAYVEGRIGSGDYQGIWGGLKFYFGQTDKTLIRRHREDDPGDHDDPLNNPGTLRSTHAIPCGECNGGNQVQ